MAFSIAGVFLRQQLPTERNSGRQIASQFYATVTCQPRGCISLSGTLLGLSLDDVLRQICLSKQYLRVLFLKFFPFIKKIIKSR